LLVVLPWSGFWEHNYFAAAWPPLQAMLTNNFVRGAVTGLGLVNLCAGFADLARVFVARPSAGSGRSDPLDGRDSDMSLRDGSGRS
jgi:hypothetical protein